MLSDNKALQGVEYPLLRTYLGKAGEVVAMESRKQTKNKKSSDIDDLLKIATIRKLEAETATQIQETRASIFRESIQGPMGHKT